MRKSTSELLVNSCDEFIFYEDLEASEIRKPAASHAEREARVFRLLWTLGCMRRETSGPLYSS